MRRLFIESSMVENMWPSFNLDVKEKKGGGIGLRVGLVRVFENAEHYFRVYLFTIFEKYFLF